MATLTDSLVGRRAELRVLLAALESARQGAGRIVLLAGEPGIGKTPVVHELAQDLSSKGSLVLWGHCREEPGAPPYWLWVRVIRAALASLPGKRLDVQLGPGGNDLVRLVPELHDHLPAAVQPTTGEIQARSRFLMFDAVTRLLGAISRRQPLVVVLEDLHWADTPSLRLLEFLAPEIAYLPILLIGTYRDIALSRQHPLSDALGGLIRTPHVERITLTGLSLDEIRRFVALATEVVPPEWLTRALREQTEGNPLFLHEVIRFLRQQGYLDGAGSGPTLAAGTLPPIRIPEGVRDVIGRRLNMLSAACNDVLAMAAVIGRDFNLDLLVRASTDRDADYMLATLDEAAAARLIEEQPGGTYQFTHALIRMTLYDEIGPGRRRGLHHAIGEAMEALHGDDLDPVLPDLTRHFHASGMNRDLDRIITYATKAADRAISLFAYEDAARYYQLALDTMARRRGADPAQRAGLLLRLGTALRRSGATEEALSPLRQAAREAQACQAGNIQLRAVLEFEFTAWRGGVGAYAEVEFLAHDALGAVEEVDPALRIQTEGALARAVRHRGAREEGSRRGHDALMAARVLGNPSVLAVILDYQLTSQGVLDDLDTAERLADELHDVARLAGHMDCYGHAMEVRLALAFAKADLTAVEANLNEYARHERAVREVLWTAVERGWRITLALIRGDLTTAERLILGLLEFTRRHGKNMTDQSSVHIFTLRREQGRLGELFHLADAFLRERDSSLVWGPGLALFLTETGRLDDARPIFESLARDDFISVPRDGRLNISLAYLAEVCAALGHASSARVLYQQFLPMAGRYLITGDSSGCIGASDRFLGLMAATMGDWDRAEAHFQVALHMSERLGADAHIARTSLDLGRMYRVRGGGGDTARAAEQFTRVREIAMYRGLVALANQAAASLEMVNALPIAPDDLTPREMEVLRLIAIGRANADIAMALAISLNTAQTHVRNILAKTDCTNRTEAAAYAVRHGIHLPTA